VQLYQVHLNRYSRAHGFEGFFFDSKFCEECGDEKSLLCYDCVGWTDDPDENWTEDNLN
jgi:hypothetical protein